jgi:hypothetical protein
VTDDRPHRTSPQPRGGVLSRWTRSALGVGTDPPLRRPRPLRVEPVRRSWVGAFWQARIGVRAGMTLDDFLRSRFARYLAGLPVPRARLPLAIDVDGGQVVVRATAEPSSAPAARDDVEPWLAALVALEGPAVRQEVAHLEVRLAMLDGEIEAARRRADELSRKLGEDIAAGIVAGPPEVNATAEQLGRPPVRSAGLRTVAVGFAASALAAETWQIGQPLLRSAGLDPANLAADATRRPAEVALASVFALGVAAGVFALTHVGLRAAASLVAEGPDARRRRWLGAAALGAGALAALIATAVAALPRPAAGAHPSAAALALLLVAVPLAAALVLRAAEREQDQRALDLAAALAWDRERARALAERVRRIEELSWAEDDEHALEAQRDVARRRLRDVNVRAVTAARHAAEAERRERASLSRLAQSLVGALELDRYEFVRQATARGAHELIAPRRRPGAEPRPSFDEATAPVAAPVARVEAGRLAS